MLYKINHDNKSKLWCGPAAIAAITGYSTSEITRTARSISGRPQITGMSRGLLQQVMERLGYQQVRELHPCKMTLAAFSRAHSADFASHPMTVGVTNHWIVLAGRRFVDNFTRDPVWLTDAPHRRATVKWACSWRKVSEARVAPPPAPRPGASQSASDMRKARRMAGKAGLRIERDGDGYWVLGPLDDSPSDPLLGNHFCVGGLEVLSNVELYVAALRKVSQTA